MRQPKTTIEELLNRAVSEVIVRDELAKKLAGRRRLRIKFGIDPTGDKIHLGHAVIYWKLRAFQELGHHVIILIGDYTAQIGDTSDKTAERQALSADQVKSNMKHYLTQIGQIVDLEKAEIRYNSEWLKKLELREFLELASQFKVAQMLERDNFNDRFKAGKAIGLQEFLYPVMQGYDSVKLHADVELGGNDQLFNLMAGRTLQRRAGQDPQSTIVTDLLIGTDGKKMSKTSPNCIFINDSPLDMYGKVMAINDDMIFHYFRLATDTELIQIEAMESNTANGDNPREAKAALARTIVSRYYSETKALEAEQAWEQQFQAGQLPDDIEIYEADAKELADPVGLLANAFKVTKSEIRRLIDQSGVKIDGVIIESADQLVIRKQVIAQIGKRRFRRITI